MLYAVNKAEEERAIRYLMDNIPKDCMEKVMDKIQNEGDRWLLLQHLRFGMYIRNTLREGGFNWDSLDYMWSPLIKKAVRIMQYKFGPASPKEKIVFGANRPGKHSHAGCPKSNFNQPKKSKYQQKISLPSIIVQKMNHSPNSTQK